MATPTEIAVTAIVGLLSAIVASVTTVLVKRQPALVTAEAAAQTTVNDGFAKLSAVLLERMEVQEIQIRELVSEVGNLTQHVYSLEKILRDNGLPIPVRQRPGVFSVLPANMAQ